MYEKNCIFAFLKHDEQINQTFTIYLYYSHLVHIKVQF